MIPAHGCGTLASHTFEVRRDEIPLARWLVSRLLLLHIQSLPLSGSRPPMPGIERMQNYGRISWCLGFLMLPSYKQVGAELWWLPCHLGTAWWLNIKACWLVILMIIYEWSVHQCGHKINSRKTAVAISEWDFLLVMHLPHCIWTMISCSVEVITYLSVSILHSLCVRVHGWALPLQLYFRINYTSMGGEKRDMQKIACELNSLFWVGWATNIHSVVLQPKGKSMV